MTAGINCAPAILYDCSFWLPMIENPPRKMMVDAAENKANFACALPDVYIAIPKPITPRAMNAHPYPCS